MSSLELANQGNTRVQVRSIDTDGIYRVSGNLSAIQKIRCAIDQGIPVAGTSPTVISYRQKTRRADKYAALVNETDVHVLSGCLKLFFRELAEAVFPPAATKAFLAAASLRENTGRLGWQRDEK